MSPRIHRLAVLLLLAVACFDPLYELGPGRSYTVCCRAGRINTCECLEGQPCSYTLTACASNTCVEQGVCGGGGTGGGIQPTPQDAGHGTGGGSAGTGGGSAGTGGGAGGSGGSGGSGGAGAGGGQGGVGGASAGGGGGTPAGPTTYEPCCDSGKVGTCPCPGGLCARVPFTPCAGGRCVGAGETCP